MEKEVSVLKISAINEMGRPQIHSPGFYKKCVQWFMTLAVLTIIMPCIVYAHHPRAKNEEVMEAYELRMKGQADDAKELLLSILKNDSTNAMANFEMARLITATDIMNTEAGLVYIGKAILSDPDNTLYLYYKANALLLKAYIEMERGHNESVHELIEETCAAYENVLSKKPDCIQAFMYLIDIYGSLPAELGGNKEKAESYVKSLSTVDAFYGARGKFVLLQETMKETDYWEKYISENGETDDALELLGKAWLINDNPQNAQKCFDKILAHDPSKTILNLDMARLYIMHVMQRISPAETELPKVKEYIMKYLESAVEKPVSIQAWCYGILSNAEAMLGTKDQADIYLQKARSLYPDFSRAFAIPATEFPPNEMVFVYKSFFKPF